MKFIGMLLTVTTLALPLTAGSIDKKLLKAVLAGDTALVQALIEQGANANHTVRGKESLLICASERGLHQVAKILIENGAEVDHRTKKGETALHRAAKFGRYQIAQELIESGVDVQATLKKANAPLHLAIERRDFSMVKLLLDHGADVDQQDYQGRAPLHLAAAFDTPLYAETLLVAGAAVNLQDDMGNTPLHYAVLENRADIAKRLLQFDADPTLENMYDESAEFILEPRQKAIMAHFATVEQISPETLAKPLHLDLKSLKKFLADGMDINHMTQNGKPILFFAIESGDLEVLQHFIDQGADLNKTDSEGISALMIAAVNGRMAIVQKLLKHGANPNALSQDGFGALYLAGLRKDEHLAKALIEHGALRVARILKDDIHIPSKKAGYHALLNQMYWLPNLTQASFMVGKYMGPAKKTSYPEAYSLGKRSRQDLKPPKFTFKAAPAYPEAARRHNIQGYVIIEAVLTKEGFIDEFRVLRALGKGRFGFEMAAIDALRRWQFRPGEIKGNPVDVRMTLKMDFTLR